MHIRYLIAAFSLFYVVLGNTATAALVISMSPTTQDVAQGGVGFLEFSIDTTGMGDIDLAAFNVTITVPDTSGITFTGGDDNVLNYAFFGETLGFAFADPMIAGTNGGDILDLSDNPLGTTLAEGTYGLGRMFFSVDANAPVGLVNFTLDAATSFTDGNFDPIDFTPLPGATLGTINVQATAVPEPSSIGLLAIAGSGLIIARRRKQKLLRAAT